MSAMQIVRNSKRWWTLLAEKIRSFASASAGRRLAIEDGRAEPALAIERALDGLRAFDPGVAQVVELRFFGGHNLDVTAQKLNVSRQAAKRDWVFGKAWLRVELLRQRPS